MWRAAALLALSAVPAIAEGVASARYDDPTTRYAHGILGDAVEWGALVMTGTSGKSYRLMLPETRVFEDIAPRLADIDDDGDLEIIAVESDLSRGSRLSVYGTEGLIASNEFIGRPNRWLAPVGVGAADLDGDGRVEFAYVDRPHLAKTLVIMRREGRRLVTVAALEGVTNHRIGDTEISGGVRDCGEGPEMIVASADWSQVVEVRFDGAGFSTRALAAIEGRPTFARALACEI
jgi:hypothetical protein